MPRAPGRFVWYELMTTNSAAATAFYSAVIGWRAQDAGLTDLDYTILSADGENVAGLMMLPEEAWANGARPCWRGHVSVENVDDAVARLTAAGSTVYHPPEDVPVGRFASVADPQGAVFVMFQPHPTLSARPTAGARLGHVGWHELTAADLPGAMDFYTAMFGWQQTDSIDMGPLGLYQLFATDTEAVGGMMTRLDPDRRPSWLYYFNVGNIEQAAERVRDGGGGVSQGPNQVAGGGWVVQCRDPQGIAFALLAPG